MTDKTSEIRAAIDEFNQTWGLSVRITRILFWKELGAAYRPMKQTGWIYVGPDLTLQETYQDVFHELGHALIHQYKMHLSQLKLFHDDSPKYTMPTIQRKHCQEELPPPDGFVSWYATFNGSEDFCETLSALVTNDYSTKKMNFFENRIPVSSSPRLRKKLKEVERILRALKAKANAA